MNVLKARDMIKELWPKLKHIWPWDRQYEPLTLDELKSISDIVRKTKIIFPDGTSVFFGDTQNVGELWDCDDFACGGEFLTKLYCKVQADKGVMPKIARPFGQARGYQFRGMAGLHALNIVILKDGVYFNDYEDGGRIWKANPENDILFYVSL